MVSHADARGPTRRIAGPFFLAQKLSFMARALTISAILGSTRKRQHNVNEIAFATSTEKRLRMYTESLGCPCRQPFGDSDDEDIFVFESDDECRLRQEVESLAEYQTLLRKKTLQKKHIQVDIDKTTKYIEETAHKIALLRACVELQNATAGGK